VQALPLDAANPLDHDQDFKNTSLVKAGQSGASL